MFMKAERQTGPSALAGSTQRYRLEVTSIRSETGVWLGMLTQGNFFLWMKNYLRESSARTGWMSTYRENLLCLIVKILHSWAWWIIK